MSPNPAVEKAFGEVTARRLLSRLILLLVFTSGCLTAPFSINAQSTRPDRGTGNGPQHVTDLDNINLQNGSVSMAIPLASLPPVAGGKLGYTLTAHYNSNLWRAWRSESGGPVDGGLSCPQMYTTGLIEPVTPPSLQTWMIGEGYKIVFKDAYLDDFTFIVPSQQCDYYESTWMQGRFFRPVLITPDGGEHEMRIDGTYATYHVNGTRSHLSGYYKYLGTPNQPTFSTPTRFYTVDGTYFTAIVNPSSYSTKWTIWAKDGTKIEQMATVQTITDANGNSIERGHDSTYNFEYAKDVYTGRMIKWSNVQYNGNYATQVQYQSTGGSWQSVYVTWGSTTVRGFAYTTTAYDDYMETPCAVDEIIPQTNFTVIREIEFPNTESGVAAPKYTFSYNSDTSASVTLTNPKWSCNSISASYSRTVSDGWGQLSSVTTPSGAVIRYEYTGEGTHDFRDNGVDNLSQEEATRHKITSKYIDHDSVTDTWTYSFDEVPGGTAWGAVTAPDGSTSKEMYSPTNVNFSHLSGYNGQNGLVYRSTKPGGIMIERDWTLLGGTNLTAFGSFSDKVTYNAVVDTEYTTLLDTDGTTRLKMTAKTFTYDYNGDLTSTTEYDWINLANVSYESVTGVPTGIPSGTAVVRVTNNSYYNTASSSTSTTAYHKRTLGSSPVILGKVKQATVRTSSITKSDTKFSYDGNSWGTVPSLGNLTKVSAYNDTTSSWIDSTTTYDSKGNVTSTVDGNGNTTCITYGSISGYYNLYPTQVVQACGTGVARTMQTGYDFSTGLVTSVTDYDNSVTATTAYDIKLRPILVTNADGSTLESEVHTQYYDHARFIVTKADLVSAGDGKKVAIQHFDQLGRARLSRTLEDASTQDATDEEDGIKVETKYAYTSGYSWQLTSNPFRASSSANAGSEETMGWTRSKSWATGRQAQVETFSGASMPAPWGSNSSSTGVVDTQIAANATTVTDQASKVRRSITDPLGRLERVDEPTTSGLGTLTSPNQATSYAYDVLNNLTGVTQGSQSRSFSYNSLGRLTSAANPESGTISYVYDSNGNLTSKTDARSIVTSYTYDALNRVTQRAYAAPSPTPANYQTTPTVTYTYDNKTNAKGRLTKISSSISTTEYTSFDVLGRVTGHKQTTGGNDYTTSYTYNLAGQLLTETYPSGRMVENTFLESGNLSRVRTKPSGGSYSYRAKNFVYNPAGAVESMQLGNLSRYETTEFNSRLQPTQIGLGTSTTDTSLLKLEYEYGATASVNNGNLTKQTITVPGMTYSLVQNYTYDELNRLASATETSNLTQTWTQVFGYDRYGNRNITSGTGQTSLTFGSTNNRITTTGYSYDSAGNTTADPSGSKGFTYDGENKQVLSTGGGWTTGIYEYDGDGKRVRKYGSSTGDNTLFVYNAAGVLIEEYTLWNNPPTLVKSYVYAGSRLLSTETASGTNYLTADNLGSPRINTDGSGNVVARHDYHPFGEEIDGSGGRTTGLGYQTDGVRKQFTGFERDGESGLDYAQARYSAYQLGRFTSPDPLMASARRANPQTFNRYTYVLNNPLNLVDPIGLSDCPPGQTCTIPCKKGEPGCFTDLSTEIAVVEVRDESVLEEVKAPPVALSTAVALRPLLPMVAANPALGFLTAAIATIPASIANDQSGQPASLIDIARTPTGQQVLMTAITSSVTAAPAVPDVATDRMPPPSGGVLVTHYTSEATVQAIRASGGILNAGSYVTLPSEIASGSTAERIEQRLEILPGRAAYSITFQTPSSNLVVPANGVTTSGGAIQFQLRGPTPINPALFVRTPR